MSNLPIIHPEKNAWAYMKMRIQKLILFDEVRVMELLESLQFGIAYLVVGFMTGTLLDWAFPAYNEEKGFWEVFREVVLQCVLLIIVVFYIRKIVKVMPFLFVINFDINGDGKIRPYHPYSSTEYSGEIMIALAVVGSQFNLIKKFDLLSRKAYKEFFNEERKIGVSLGI
jgi:hypothetical protein